MYESPASLALRNAWKKSEPSVIRAWMNEYRPVDSLRGPDVGQLDGLPRLVNAHGEVRRRAVAEDEIHPGFTAEAFDERLPFPDAQRVRDRAAVDGLLPRSASAESVYAQSSPRKYPADTLYPTRSPIVPAWRTLPCTRERLPPASETVVPFDANGDLRDEIDDAVVGVRPVERRRGPADHLDPLEVVVHDRDEGRDVRPKGRAPRRCGCR